MNIKIIVSFFLFITIATFSQEQKINKYKYVIVPEKFDFLKRADQYQTSSLTKFLFKKKGFSVFLSNEKLPNDLLLNRCKSLSVSVVDESGLLTVKSKIVIKDCYGETVYISDIGKSKNKDYKKAYHEAIRRAVETMGDVQYDPSIEDTTVATASKVAKNQVEKKGSLPAPMVIETLNALPKNNGFQLVNKASKVIFEVLKTRKEDVYIIKGKDGSFYKNDEKWYAEFYENDKLVKKEYKVNF